MKSFERQAVRWFVAVAMLSVTIAVHAENYPNRDITFINPYNPGGSTDPLIRQFCPQLEKILGGNINIESKPGGGGTIGVGIIVRAKPDGYTIGLGANAPMAYYPLVMKDLAYKTPDDYQSIVKMIDLPPCLFVRADAPWKTFEEFMADVRKNPGKIRASNSGLAGSSYLVTMLLNKVAGVKITPVPFTGGGGEALIALLGGRVEANIGYSSSALGNIQAGKIRVLAVFKKGKYETFPDATPVYDAGYDVTLPTANYVIAPKGLPKEVLSKLVAGSLQVVRSEEFRKWGMENGYVVDPKGPEEMKAELVQYGKIFVDLVKFMDQK